MRLTLRPYQLEALDRIAAAEARGVRRQLGVAATGLGKAQPVDEPVLTTAGWRKIGELRVGDSVVGTDGRPTRVEGVYPQGRRRIYRVTTDDGAWTRADADHLWTVSTDSAISRGRPWRTMTTTELLAAGVADASGRRRWRLPIADAVAPGGSLSLPLDPYVLGVLLGDGCLTRGYDVTFSSEDAAVATMVAERLASRVRVVPIGVGEGRCPAWRLSSRPGAAENPVTGALRRLGVMGHGAATKFVPDQYLRAHPIDRLALLRGLMDTDGWAGEVVQFTTISAQLAEDVTELVRSLGGVARQSGKIPTYRDRDGERRQGQFAHTITMRLPAVPFALDRKRQAYEAKRRLPPTRKIARIEPDGEDEAVCIKVAAEDSLYVTRGHIVTHNTVVFCALAERRGGRTLILAHRDELISQAEAKVREVWPEADVGVVKAERNEVRAQVVVASVQTLARARRLEQLAAPYEDPGIFSPALAPFDLVVVDEAHHSAADSYRAILDRLRAGQPGCPLAAEGVDHDHERIATPEEVSAGCELGITFDPCPGPAAGPLLLGVTATPDRGDGKGLDDLFDEVTFAYDILWGIRSDYLADLRGVRVSVDTLDMSGVKVRRGDYDQGQTGRAMEEAQAERFVVKAWQEHAADRQTLVFTPTVEVARLVAEEFRHAGVRAEHVHGGTPLDERRSILRRYSEGDLQVIANCAVLTEGYDEPRTDCIVVARPTKSRALYCFDAETEVLTPEGWVKGNAVSEGEPIAAFDPATEWVQWEPVLATVERPLLPGERMMALRSPSVDLRVTDTHRMVWRYRQGRQRQPTRWQISTAGALAQRADVWELPVAGVEKAPGVPLTDAELAFIGWVQTDGCVNHSTGAVQISQQYPEQRRHIEETLNACGFKWRVSETSAPTAYGERRYPLAVYRISRGAPRGEDKHLRGWGELAPWIPKASGAEAWQRLEDVDADQWAVLLDAWHRGDGAKQNGQTWTRRGYHLSIADEWTAGWVQGMCMRRGWRANIAQQGTVWIVHCRQGAARYIGGASSADRPRLVETPELPGERVWCVSVASGAILTRRNGKGAIVGQTQMVGRGTRRHPDKTDCLVLDVVGASAQHSLVTVPLLFGLEDQLAEAMADGTRGLAGVVQERDDELVRIGKLRAEEADLFRQMRAEGVAWAPVHREGELRRYVCSVGKDASDPRPLVVVLAQRGPEAWTAGLWWQPIKDTPGAKRALIADVSMELAQGVAEEFVRRHAPDKLTRTDAEWRARKPTPKQKAAAAKWKMKVDPAWTAGDLSDALSAHIARRKAEAQ